MVDLSRFAKRKDAQSVAAPTSTNPYDDAVSEIDHGSARANLLDDTTSPADAIQAKQLSRRMGLPPETISADTKGFSTEDGLKAWNDVIDSSPGLRQFIGGSRINAAAAKDDREALANVSQTFQTADQAGDPLGQRYLNGYRQQLRNSTAVGLTGAINGGAPAPATPLMDNIKRNVPDNLARSLQGQPDATPIVGDPNGGPRTATLGNIAEGHAANFVYGLGAPVLGVARAVADKLGFGDEFAQSDFVQTRQRALESMQAEGNVQYKSLGNLWGMEINPGQWGYSATDSLAQMGAAFTTGSPLTALSVLTGGEFYNRARARGAGINESKWGAFATGAIEAATELAPLNVLEHRFGKQAIGKFLAGYLPKEVGGEMAATLGQNAVDALVTGGVGWDQYVKSLPQDLLDTAGSTLLMGGALGALNHVARTSATAHAGDVIDIGRATAGAAWMDQQMGNAEASKLRKADPEYFKEFVDEHTQDSPVRDIYVPIETVRALQQSEGYEPGFFEKYQDQIDQAQATQGDLVIPMRDAFAELAGTPTWEAIKDNVRLYPGGMSQKEALEQHGEIMRTLEQRGAEIAKEVLEGTDSPASEVYTEVKNRLLAGGVQVRQAETVAQLYAARYETRAAQMGGTAMDQLKAAKIVFPSEQPGSTGGREVAQDVGRLKGFLRDAEPGALNGLTRKQNRARSALEKEGSPLEVVLPLNSLIGTQQSVNGEAVEQPTAKRNDGFDLPVVFKVNGRFLVGDGHHRLARAAANGESVARVRLFDIDGATGQQPVDPSVPLFDAKTLNQDVMNVDENGNTIAEPETPVTRELYQGDVFYSAAEKVVADAKQAKATAAQWKALLTPGKTPGIKAEEIEWSGIHDWLDMQEGPVSKDVLLQVLRDRGIKVEEVTLGEPDFHVKEVNGRFEVRDGAGTLLSRFGSQEEADRYTRIARVEDNTQFKSWSSDPSNDTYRELLITLPIGQGGNPSRAPDTHWDTESVVAHTRFMEKTDAEGKRVLFIEEVQSDWHQKGRDQGYANPLPEAEQKRIIAAFQTAQGNFTVAKADFLRSIPEDRRPTFEPIVDVRAAGMTSELMRLSAMVSEEAFAAAEKLVEARLRLSEAAQDATNLSKVDGIPEAPFKSSWPALVMKRVIRWAVDHGYERVAWTTGAEQSSRYNLSQAVGLLSASREKDGRLKVIVGNSSAASTLRSNGLGEDGGNGALLMSDAQAKEAFGGDVAAKLVERADAAGGEYGAPLQAGDLTVGGEGMRAFYDRNLVNITNDIVKKYGAKVGPVPMPDPAGEATKRQNEREYLRLSMAAASAVRSVRAGVERGTMTQADLDRAQRNLDVANEDLTTAQQSFVPSRKNPGFDITDKMRDAARSGFTLFQNPQGPRGSVTFMDNGEKVIQLFSTANASTLLHETSHIWLEELREDAANPNAPQQVRDDWAKIERWFNEQGQTIQPGVPIPTEAHELFARGGERYFMEGKAPTGVLAGAFKTFRAWLLRIYQVAANLRSPINDDVRGVFDRLLATQDAIDQYRDKAGVKPLFNSAEEAGMTDAEFAAYQKSVGEARDEAYDAMLYRTMEAIRRQRTAKGREQRRSVRDEVASEINTQPQFIALHLLRTGMWLGDPNRPRQDVKLNTGWLIDNFGEDILDKLPRGLPITKGDGVDGDTVAEMVGAESGQSLVHALVGMRVASEALRAGGEKRSLRDRMIDDRTDELMAQRYGDPINDGSIEEEAVAALNTARQGEVIAQEARQLAKRNPTVTQPLTPYQFAREWAKRIIGQGRVTDVASRMAVQRYTRATAKAQRAAEKAILGGDTAEAYKQKQAQLLNHALLAEAKAAADEIDTIVARMRKLAGRAAMKSVDQDYLDKVHMLLERYDFRPRSQKSIDEAEGFQDWLEAQRAKGFEVHIPPRLENKGDPYSRVSVEELRSLNDLVESLMHLGRTKQTLKVAKQERDFGEFRDEVAARIRQLPVRKLPEKPINEERRFGASSAAELLKVETIVEELDGGKTGPLHDALILGATEAENKRHALRQKVLHPIAVAYKKLSRKQWARFQEKVTIPELTWNTLNEGDPRLGQPVTMTRSELISVLLNMGNLSNLEKLSKGERWPVATLNAVVQRELTKEDFDFAQMLWDQVNSLWPQIVATERELSGVVPEQVVPTPLDTPYGTYAGGYWPVVYDADRWQRAEDLEGKQLDDMFGLKSGVATQKGHTITRTAAFGPIQLSLENVMFTHLEQVVTRLAFSAYARDVLRIVRDKTIRGLIDTHLGPEYRKQIEPWLARQIHQGAVHAKAARYWQRILRQFRVNMTVAAMGFRLSTGVAQTVGLTASAQRIGAKYVGVGLKRLALSPRQMAKFVDDRSPEMANRMGNVNREVADVFNKLQGKHSKFTEMQAWAMWHIGMVDRYVVSIPTWLGAHQKGLDEGMTDAEASAYADKEVRLSQGAGQEKDLSAFQSPNNEAMKFFSMFYTPFNVLFNAQWQGVRGLKQGNIKPMIGVTFWWMIASVLGDAMLSGDWPKNLDGELDWESFIGWFARNVFFGMFSGIPIARDIANTAENKVAGNYAPPLSTPISRVYDTVEKAIQDGERYRDSGDLPNAPIKEAGNTAAIVTGTPLSQLGTTAQFAWDYGSGDADPQSVSDWYFGITRGKVPPKDGSPKR